MLDAKDILLHPVTKSPVQISGEQVVDPTGKTVGDYHADIQLIDWITHVEFPGLDNRVLSEINKYDGWAAARPALEPNPIDADSYDINQDKIYASNEYIQKLNLDLSTIFRGKDVLDIGGSCIDAWRFWTTGMKSLHQVEVSKASQIYGRDRMKSKLGEASESLSKTMFHTCPAEFLPFQDACFDVVFSRSSIHHTQRGLSLAEIERVLKPGGIMLLFEPFQHVMINKAMHTLRNIRNIDRGTDDPLTIRDIRLMQPLFEEITHEPKSFLPMNLQVASTWLFGGKPSSIPVLIARK